MPKAAYGAMQDIQTSPEAYEDRFIHRGIMGDRCLASLLLAVGLNHISTM